MAKYVSLPLQAINKLPGIDLEFIAGWFSWWWWWPWDKYWGKEKGSNINPLVIPKDTANYYFRFLLKLTWSEIIFSCHQMSLKLLGLVEKWKLDAQLAQLHIHHQFLPSPSQVWTNLDKIFRNSFLGFPEKFDFHISTYLGCMCSTLKSKHGFPFYPFLLFVLLSLLSSLPCRHRSGLLNFLLQRALAMVFSDIEQARHIRWGKGGDSRSWKSSLCPTVNLLQCIYLKVFQREILHLVCWEIQNWFLWERAGINLKVARESAAQVIKDFGWKRANKKLEWL